MIQVRCRNMEPSLDLSNYEGIDLRVKGDGLRYKAILRCDTGWDSMTYCRCFPPPSRCRCTSSHVAPCWPCLNRMGRVQSTMVVLRRVLGGRNRHCSAFWVLVECVGP